MDIVTARVPCLVDHDSRRGLPPLWQTETAVAYQSAWGTHPLLVQDGLHEAFAVAVEKTWAAELPPDPLAVLVVAHGLCVDGLLSALVACGAAYSVVDLVRASLRDFDVVGGGVGGWHPV